MEEGDLADLLNEEGNAKPDNRRIDIPKENKNSFLSLIKSNVIHINDSKPTNDKVYTYVI